MSFRDRMARVRFWIRFGFFLFFGIAMLIAGVYDYRISRFYDSHKAVSLATLIESGNKEGLIKLENYRADIKNRLRALPDKTTVEDLHILVPLRLPEERENDDIQVLYRMEDGSSDPVKMLYDTFQRTGQNLLVGDMMFVEISSLEDLPGNVPNVVRDDKRVAKNVWILQRQRNDRMYDFLFFMGSIFLVLAGWFYWRDQRRQRKGVKQQ